MRTNLTKLANDQREKALLSLGTGIVGESISPKHSEIEFQKSRQMKLPCLPPKRASQTIVHSAMNKTQVKQSIVNLNPYRALVTPIINVSKAKRLANVTSNKPAVNRRIGIHHCSIEFNADGKFNVSTDLPNSTTNG